MMSPTEKWNIVNFKHRVWETIYYIRGKNLVEAKVIWVIMKIHDIGGYSEYCELDNWESKMRIASKYDTNGQLTFHTKEWAKRYILWQSCRDVEEGFVWEKVEIKYNPWIWIYNVEWVEVKKNCIVSCTISLHEETQKITTYESKSNPSFFEKLLWLTQIKKTDIQKAICLHITYSLYGRTYRKDLWKILYRDWVYSLDGEDPWIFYHYDCAREKLKELVDKL